MPEEENDKKPTVAYVPFKTFLTAVETLEHGLPDVVDRTVWPSFSGVTQSQVLGAFRFLGLINPDGKPTHDLEKLVSDKNNRKAHLRKLLELSYPELIKRDLTKMSAGSFDGVMREYGLQGETHRKAASFFLQAARYAELPLSPYILKQTRSASGPRKRRERAKPYFVETMTGATDENYRPTSESTKTVELRSGGQIVINVSGSIWNMGPEDREFVLTLIDKVREYEEKGGPKKPAAKAEKATTG